MTEDGSKPYEPPELTEFGTVEELTDGLGTSTTDAQSGSPALP